MQIPSPPPTPTQSRFPFCFSPFVYPTKSEIPKHYLTSNPKNFHNVLCLFFYSKMHNFLETIIDYIKLWHVRTKKITVRGGVNKYNLTQVLLREKINKNFFFKGGGGVKSFLFFKVPITIIALIQAGVAKHPFFTHHSR